MFSLACRVFCKRVFFIASYVLVLTLLWTGHCFAAPDKGVNIILQLKWYHQFQFAGYYVALERGYFKDEGINLRIKEGSPTINVVDEVLSGRADFGIGTSELVVDYIKGRKVVVVGVIYQHSPLVLLTRLSPDVQQLSSLPGKSVCMESHSADLMAMFRQEGVDVSKLKFEPHSGTLDAIKSGKVAAMSAYLTDEVYELNKEGVPFLTHSPRSYGIDFYGDNFFTSADFAKNSPEVLKAFRRAVVRGWEEAVLNPEAAINLILRKYSGRKTKEHLLFEARETIMLMTRLVKPGHMLLERWNSIARTYKNNKMIPYVPDLKPFVFTDETEELQLPSWFFPVLAVGGILLLLFGGGFLYLKRLNGELRRALEEIKTLRGILPICSFCKKVRDDEGAWEQIEIYIREHSHTVFSHSICPDCAVSQYADEVDAKKLVAEAPAEDTE